ncbi:MAG TPA: PASTA domain-containing protein [Longimicrobiales bacterium]|nr:PASTA domain-containing protein [Longimicrobiales bacterium]
MRLGGSLERRRGRPRRPVSAGERWRGLGSGPRVLLLGVGLVLGGWLIGYLVSTQLLFPAPAAPRDLFEVPDLRGLGLASARERLAGVGLTLGDVDSVQHPFVPSALILGQSPLPGQVARPETPVRVTVSLGPELRPVPDVLRLDADRARILLETTGFRVTTDTVEAELPRGRVVEVHPPPDSIVPLPAQVELVISAGPPVVPMPLVLGMEEEEAVALLDSLGLVVGEVEEVFRFGRDQGIVVEQEPASDSLLERGSTVRLRVGRRGLGRGDAGDGAGSDARSDARDDGRNDAADGLGDREQ